MHKIKLVNLQLTIHMDIFLNFSIFHSLTSIYVALWSKSLSTKHFSYFFTCFFFIIIIIIRFFLLDNVNMCLNLIEESNVLHLKNCI
jgi:hypothetical protein